MNRQTFRTLALWAFTTAALTWVAFWNRSPIFFGDTASYLKTALTGGFPTYRPTGYPLVLLAAVWTNSFWVVVWLQSGVAAWLMIRVLQWDFSLGLRACLFAILFIALSTTLPWWTGTIMSDIWAALTALAVYHLLFHWYRPGQVERAFMVLTLLVGLTCHLSAVLIVGIFLPLVMFLALFMWRPGQLSPPFSKWGAVLVLGATVLSGAAFPLANLAANDVLFPSTGAARLILARIAADGLLLDMLKERCGDPKRQPYALCSQINSLQRYLSMPPVKKPHEKCPCSQEGYVTWMLNFDKGAPLREVYLKDKATDAGRVLMDSLCYDPWGHLWAVVEGTWDIYGNAGISPFIDGNKKLGGFLQRTFENAYAAFQESRSYNGSLHARTFNIFLLPLVWFGGVLGFVALGVLTLGRSVLSRIPDVYGIWCRNAAFCFLYVVVNAAIMYAAVGDHTRYQSRCSWLMAMQPVLLLAVFLMERKKRLNRTSNSGRAVVP